MVKVRSLGFLIRIPVGPVCFGLTIDEGQETFCYEITDHLECYVELTGRYSYRRFEDHSAFVFCFKQSKSFCHTA